MKVTSRSFWSVPPPVIVLEEDSCPVKFNDRSSAADFIVSVSQDNAVKNPDGTNFGRDVFVWGYNEHYQVGRITLWVPSWDS